MLDRQATFALKQGSKPPWIADSRVSLYDLLQSADYSGLENSYVNFSALKTVRRRTSKGLGVRDASQESADELGSSQSSQKSRSRAAQSEPRSSSLPARQLPDRTWPAFDSLSDDTRHDQSIVPRGRPWSQRSRRPPTHRRHTMERKQEQAAQPATDSDAPFTHSAPARVIQESDSLQEGQRLAATQTTQSEPSPPSAAQTAADLQPSTSRHVISSRSTTSSRRYEGLDSLAWGGQSSGDSRYLEERLYSREGSDEDSSMDEADRPGSGVLDRIQESSGGDSDAESGKSTRDQLHAQAFSMEAAMALMGDVSSDSEATRSSDIEGFMDDGGGERQQKAEDTSGSACEGSFISLPTSQAGLSLPPSRQRLDTEASIDSLRRAAASMLETPQEQTGSEEDVSGLATPEFCTPSPSPFKDATATQEEAPALNTRGGVKPLIKPVAVNTAPEAVEGDWSQLEEGRLPEGNAALISLAGTQRIAMDEDTASTRQSIESGGIESLSHIVLTAGTGQDAVGTQQARGSSSQEDSRGSFAFSHERQKQAIGQPSLHQQAIDNPTFQIPQPDPPSLAEVGPKAQSATPLGSRQAPVGVEITPEPFLPEERAQVSGRPDSARKLVTPDQATPSLPGARQPASARTSVAQGTPIEAEAGERRTLLQRLGRALQAVRSLSPKARKIERQGRRDSPRASLAREREQFARETEQQAGAPSLESPQSEFLTPRASYTVTVDGWPSSAESSPPPVGVPNSSPPAAPTAIPQQDTRPIVASPESLGASAASSSHLTSPATPLQDLPGASNRYFSRPRGVGPQQPPLTSRAMSGQRGGQGRSLDTSSFSRRVSIAEAFAHPDIDPFATSDSNQDTASQSTSVNSSPERRRPFGLTSNLNAHPLSSLSENPARQGQSAVSPPRLWGRSSRLHPRHDLSTIYSGHTTGTASGTPSLVSALNSGASVRGASTSTGIRPGSDPTKPLILRPSLPRVVRELADSQAAQGLPAKSASGRASPALGKAPEEAMGRGVPGSDKDKAPVRILKHRPPSLQPFTQPQSASGPSVPPEEPRPPEIQPEAALPAESQPEDGAAAESLQPETPTPRTEIRARFRAAKQGERVTVKIGREVLPPTHTSSSKRKVTLDDEMDAGTGSLGVIVMEESGIRYEGQITSSGMNGLGVLLFSSGGSYAGQWDNTQFQGAGIETFSNGSHYVGFFQGGKHHGFGVCYYIDGTTYAGAWRQGLQHGLGCQDSDGPAAFFYVGGYEAGMRQGLGVAGFGNGEEYSGEMMVDAPHGYGIAHLGSKKGTYEGQWVNGMRHGWAVSTLTNSSMWAGQWIFGKACWLAELRLTVDGELHTPYLEAMDLCEEAARLARAAGMAAVTQAQSIRLPGGTVQVEVHKATREACAAAREAHIFRQKAQMHCSSSSQHVAGTSSTAA